MSNLTGHISSILGELEQSCNLRRLPSVTHDGDYIIRDGQRMLNLSSNDYLGLASDKSLREEFLEGLTADNFIPSSSSSRLLTGNFSEYDRLEESLSRLFGKESALVFNSGYHANTGILPALADSRSLILADKLVHASIIDGIRLSQARCIRYRHNNYGQLEKLLEENAASYDNIFIVTESIFSMDGDEADLKHLVALKNRYGNAVLYVDEAHAFGVRGEKGLGCAEEQGVIGDIDLLVGTFGKAGASAGAYIVCEKAIREFLVNKMRTLIFTTALPPVNLAWTDFIVNKLPHFEERRRHLAEISEKLRKCLKDKGYDMASSSHIIPVITGESDKAVIKAAELQANGFYALPVRPPTVPAGSSRIRLSLTSNILESDIGELVTLI